MALKIPRYGSAMSRGDEPFPVIQKKVCVDMRLPNGVVW